MSRSLRVQKDCIEKVKSAVKRNNYPRQRDLAEDLEISLTTLSNFLNGKRVDHLNFREICLRLGLDWQAIAVLDENSDEQDNSEEPELLCSDFYVERVPNEAQCYEAILKPGALIRLKAPQQMGKTMLIERVLFQAREQGYQTLTLSFELADSTIFSDLRQFLRWFCASVGQNLGLPNKLDEYWDDIFGCNTNTKDYFQDYLLPKISSPLVLALDKVDLVFEHPNIANDFCRLLRSCYDLARRGDRSSILWKKLRLVVVHSTEVYSSLDINHSPLAGVGQTGYITVANEKVKYLLGLSDIEGKSVRDLIRIEEGDFANWFDAVLAAKDEKAREQFYPAQILLSQGTEAPHSVNLSIISIPDTSNANQISAILVIINDSSDEKQKQEKQELVRSVSSGMIFEEAADEKLQYG